MIPKAESGSSRSTPMSWMLPIVLIVLLVGGCLWLWREGVLQLISSHDRLVALLQEGGAKGALLCIAVQFAHVVIFIPGDITQFAAGFVFGIWKGFLFSIIGSMLGSAFAFCFARIVGRRTLERFISPTTFEKMDKLLNGAKGKSALFLLFLLPGAPKDAMSYGAGLTRMNLVEFVIITGLARCPALFASIMFGAGASRHDYRSMILTGLLLMVAIVACYLYERHRNKPRFVLHRLLSPDGGHSSGITSKRSEPY